MEKKCLKCGAVIDSSADVSGRPKSYCSTACRRAAELEIRRINKSIGDMEDRLVQIRLGAFAFHPEVESADLAGEIELKEKRLRVLLEDADSA